LECGRYIERNPLRAQIVQDPKDWSWSSYFHYAYGAADPLIDTNDLYLGLGGDPVTRQKVYRNYVQPARPYEKPLEHLHDVPIGRSPRKKLLKAV
jgi:putative transposase